MGLTRVGANGTVGQPVSPSLAKPPGVKRMRRSVRYALVLFAGFPALLGAQGFGIYEQGTCSMGRAGTGVAAPCTDGSAIFFSPAGLAGLTGGRVTIGVTLLDVEGGFTDDILQHETRRDGTGPDDHHPRSSGQSSSPIRPIRHRPRDRLR